MVQSRTICPILLVVYKGTSKQHKLPSQNWLHRNLLPDFLLFSLFWVENTVSTVNKHFDIKLKINSLICNLSLLPWCDGWGIFRHFLPTQDENHGQKSLLNTFSVCMKVNRRGQKLTLLVQLKSNLVVESIMYISIKKECSFNKINKAVKE